MVAADCNRFAGGACFLQRLGNLSGLEVGCQSAGHEHVDDMRAVNSRTYSGYYQSSNQKCRSCVLRRDAQGQEEFLNGFDFANTNAQLLNVTLLYNDTSPWYWGPPFVLRLANPLRALLDSWLNVHLEAADARTYSAGMAGIKEMPRSASFLALDIGSAMGPFFCTLAFHVLFPTLVVALVYEKEMRLRVMMRMMGLGTTAYWTINYLFWCLVYAVFCFIFMSLASIVRLPSGYRCVFVSVPCPRALGRSCMLPHFPAWKQLCCLSCRAFCALAWWPCRLAFLHARWRRVDLHHPTPAGACDGPGSRQPCDHNRTGLLDALGAPVSLHQPHRLLRHALCRLVPLVALRAGRLDAVDPGSLSRCLDSVGLGESFERGNRAIEH